MVTQLRYFGPKSSDVERANLSKLTGSATKLLKSAGKQVSDTYITARKRKPGMEKSGSGSEKSGRGITKGKSFEQSDGSSAEAGEVETSSEDDREVQKPGKCKDCLQRSGEGCRLVAKWAWRLIVQVNQLFWQFCEIHLHKIISLVMFSIILRQPGLMLLMFLVILMVSMPYRRPRFNFVFYPIFTLLLGALVLLEMCYQVRIISPGDFRLANCSEWMVRQLWSSETHFWGSILLFCRIILTSMSLMVSGCPMSSLPTRMMRPGLDFTKLPTSSPL